MSHTDIFFLKKDTYTKSSVRNAFLSAMYVWQHTAKHYCGLERFPMSFFSDDLEPMMAVWNFHSRNPGKMKAHDAIVMQSTMDNVLLEPSEWRRLLEAFELYGKEHPQSSFAEQAAIIRGVMESEEGKDVVAIGWQQTSVSGDTPWYCYEEDESGNEIVKVYDPSIDNLHHWLIETVNETEVAK
tara:strand:- start:2385 stop:2936 length:552 start_codon:yes stop_codon:yes gene_type:complete